MIEVVSLANAHLFQDTLASQARLRHEVFVRRRNLPHSTFDGMEFDEFDTPAAIYLVWRDRARVVRGVARLLRTSRPYMTEYYWPEMVETGPLPHSEDVWEVTRVCVDRTFPPCQRRSIFPELLCGIAEYFEQHGILGMIGVTSEALLSHFLRDGIQWLGRPRVVEGRVERAFFVPAAFIRPVHFCKKYAIPARVLANGASADSMSMTSSEGACRHPERPNP